MALSTIDPSTGLVVRTYEEHAPGDIEKRLQQAAATFEEWRETSPQQRANVLRAAAAELRGRKTKWASVIVEEMGKLVAAAEAEVEKCAFVCEHYAEHAGTYLAPEPAPSDASESYVRFDPIGPVLAVMPWNFPFWQVFRFCAPALAAGNVALLKHASNVPGCALAIESILAAAGLPEGGFQSLLVGPAAVAEMIRDPRVRAVTLTGSELAGARVAEAAGRALKKCVLELGGSDPFIVLADADVEKAAAAAVAARTINCGQSCIAAKRFIVEAPLHDEFVARLWAGMERLRAGDPRERATEVGPLAREDLVGELDRQVASSLAAGARLIGGGRRLERRGFYYSPTVIDGVGRGQPVWDEETFGPVAAVTAAKDVEDAIRRANDTPYGLGASLWTRDLERAARLARRIEAGSVFVNGIVKSDPRLPFGGVKRSGYGRELARYGILEFVNVKTVWVA
jgi:succinate-semialdehyde dehydrogenase/glutarate-semialdehyde dehydrogenase